MNDPQTDGMITAISPNDGMYIAGEEGHYFGVGQSALESINCSLQAARLPAKDVRRILDLPCGHGRVLRCLRAAFPEAEITACDLLRDGVEYCAATFGAVPVHSDEDPAKIPFGHEAFDLIWVGSLLTHLDAPGWDDFLGLFHRVLRPGGVLVFTAHGRAVYNNVVRGRTHYSLSFSIVPTFLHTYERTGFAYANYENWARYGISLSNPAWVFAKLARMSESRIVHFSEAGWDNHHDVYACVREPGWQVSHPRTSTLSLAKHKLRGLARRLLARG